DRGGQRGFGRGAFDAGRADQADEFGRGGLDEAPVGVGREQQEGNVTLLADRLVELELAGQRGEGLELLDTTGRGGVDREAALGQSRVERSDGFDTRVLKERTARGVGRR